MTESTATALLDAAEDLFAAEGIERASLRAVMRRAGADTGAIHYHFGSREALAAVVLDRTLVPLNERRIELLDALEADRRLLTLPALIDALVRPDVEMAIRLEARGAGRAKLVGEIYLHPASFVTRQVEERFAPVATRFLPPLVNALPDVDADAIAWRIRWLVFGTIGALLAAGREEIDPDPDATLRRLVSTFAAALAAPSHEEEP